jgi:hypothetical protein
VERQANHLREVRHCRFTGVGLPVRIRRERDGGIPRQIRRDWPHLVGIQRKDVLDPFDEICEKQTYGAEDEHGDRVLRPVVLFLFVDAAEAINEPLDRTQQRIEERPLAAKDALHVEAGRLRHGENQQKIDGDLQQLERRHYSSSARRSAYKR